MSTLEKALNFLKIAPEFQLGFLTTETPHPDTIQMSHQANNDILKAVNAIKQLDIHLFDVLLTKIPELISMQKAIHNTLNNHGKVYLSGCGATGRLSLSIEVFWREICKDPKLIDSIIGFMAGGDTALIKSIAEFEDHPEFAETQMKEIGFKEGDILIAITEGGETSWVIRSAE